MHWLYWIFNKVDLLRQRTLGTENTETRNPLAHLLGSKKEVKGEVKDRFSGHRHSQGSAYYCLVMHEWMEVTFRSWNSTMDWMLPLSYMAHDSNAIPHDSLKFYKAANLVIKASLFFEVSLMRLSWFSACPLQSVWFKSLVPNWGQAFDTLQC